MASKAFDKHVKECAGRHKQGFEVKPIIGALRRRQHARRTYDTYALGSNVVNPITVTLDAKLGEAEQRRMHSEYSKVLTTCAPAFNPSR